MREFGAMFLVWDVEAISSVIKDGPRDRGLFVAEDTAVVNRDLVVLELSFNK